MSPNRSVISGGQERGDRGIGTVLVGLVLLATGAVALAVRHLPIPGHWTLYVVIACPVLAIAAPVAALVLLWGRHWLLASLAGLLTAALVAGQMPWYIRQPPPSQSMPVRVMTINMRYGEADADVLTRVAAESADVVLVEELTPEAAKRLATAGLDRTFANRAIEPRSGAAGTGVYSRHPMIDHHVVGGFRLALVTATLSVDGAPLHVAAVHTAAPWPIPIDGWHADFAALPTLKSHLATTAGLAPIIVGGDFNATIDMKPYRDLLTDGYRDAARQAGAGRQLTYPADERFPPLIGIDHVVTRNAVAVSIRTVEVPGSDHRGLLATIMVPKVS